jgi:hypothetical protein
MSHTDKPDRACGSSFVDLRDYFTLWLGRLEVFYDRRFQDLDAKTTLALAAADKAVTKAEIATEKRFEGVNEFRQTLADQAARLMPREEAMSKFENLQKDINANAKEIQDRRNSRDDQLRDASRFRQGWVIPMIVIGFIQASTLLFLIFHK